MCCCDIAIEGAVEGRKERGKTTRKRKEGTEPEEGRKMERKEIERKI
jgi:hypothetical protein